MLNFDLVATIKDTMEQVDGLIDKMSKTGRYTKAEQLDMVYVTLNDMLTWTLTNDDIDYFNDLCNEVDAILKEED